MRTGMRTRGRNEDVFADGHHCVAHLDGNTDVIQLFKGKCMAAMKYHGGQETHERCTRFVPNIGIHQIVVLQPVSLIQRVGCGRTTGTYTSYLR